MLSNGLSQCSNIELLHINRLQKLRRNQLYNYVCKCVASWSPQRGHNNSLHYFSLPSRGTLGLGVSCDRTDNEGDCGSTLAHHNYAPWNQVGGWLGTDCHTGGRKGAGMKRDCEVQSTQLTEATGEHMATMCFKEGMISSWHKSPSDLWCQRLWWLCMLTAI